MRRVFPVFLILLLACGPCFYQAPPSLGSYPERVAAKRWPHLLAEAAPLDPALPDATALDEKCRLLPATLTPLDPKDRLAEIDRLLAANRAGPYASKRANFLHEMRELAAEARLFDAAKSYLEWRVLQDPDLPPAPPAVRPWNMPEEQFKHLQQIYNSQLQLRLTYFKEQIAKAPPPMMPYWKVRRAAFLFDIGRHDDAAADFSSVIQEFPDHPRAEAATLMLARCKIEQSRARGLAKPINPPDGVDDENRERRDEAETLLNDFITRHPQGRFTPDAHGWLGAIALDNGLLGTAVKHQLARLDCQPTREIMGSVLRECDRIFEQLLESADPNEDPGYISQEAQFDAEAVARHPLVARLFVQHCIDPAAQISLPLWWDDSDTGGRATIDFLKRRIIKPQAFVKLALSALGDALVKVKSQPDATTLTLLAWSATENGEHEQALALLDQISAPQPTDEALQARAVILQRLGRHADAVAAFDTLAKTWPNSPLVDDLPYRRSLALFQTGQSGKAILNILPLVSAVWIYSDRSAAVTDPPPNLHPEMQLLQWLDTLIQFSPLDELEKACAGTKENGPQRDLLCDAIRTRALAEHRFDVAARHLTENAQDPPAAYWRWFPSGLSNNLRMTRADWDTRVAPLAALYADLAKSPPAGEPDKIHLAIALYWMNHRGTLTLPSISLCNYAASEEEKQDLLRRRNALELGFPRDRIHRELDHRDEATHALEHALEAANSKDPAIAAPALELANQCLFRRAEFSLYQKSRALETAATQLSADIHRQLSERFPQSPEARRAVYFTFSPTAGPWMPGDYNPMNAAILLIGALDGKSSQDPEANDRVMGDIDDTAARFTKLDPKTPLAAIRRDLAAARRELDTLRPKTDPNEQGTVVAIISRLDLLQAAASLPGIAAADFHNYANNRHETLPPAFKSLLDFQDRLKPMTDAMGNHLGLKDDDVNSWRHFLELYPDSPIAEAASFRLTRLIARQYRTSRRITAFHFPEAPIPNGYKHVEVTRFDPANDPEAVIAAIDHHEKQFPMARYRDDLNLLRAGALIDTGKYQPALALLHSILANPVQRDLHVIAALEFADIAQRLLETDQRDAVATAFRRTPGAIDKLRLLVEGDTFLSRLKPLMPWLENG